MKLIDVIARSRLQRYRNVIDFNFNVKRLKFLNNIEDVPKESSALLYWMSREQRVQDNWGLLYAQRLAMQKRLPLYVCFCLVPSFLDATIRHYNFMIEGLKEVEKELISLKIPFFLLMGNAKDQIPSFVQENKIGAVICDFSPLRIYKSWIEELKLKLDDKVPFIQVDGHNIVPCWQTSDQIEQAAFKIRPKIMSKLNEFLTDFPPLVEHPITTEGIKGEPTNWDNCYNSLKVNMNIKPCDWAKPGYSAAVEMLESFINQRLLFYQADRNDPNKNAQSNLSPWLHFGQISAQRVILEVDKKKNDYPQDVEKFIDECVIWRELAENYCYYQNNYDNLNGCEQWALKTLKQHLSDKRQYIYTLEQFEFARTHDPLWNAAQIQMIKEGKMHGFFRMYWGKKILEWTETPEKALEIAVYLNDKYNLDGRDPNGYAGIMWALCGVHDHPFGERPVYGSIRHMTFEGSKKKFDVFNIIQRYKKL